MPPVITRSEYLEIDDIPLATPAWEILDLSELLNGPDLRGSDRRLPGVDGVVALPRRVDVSVRTLPMIIYGDYDMNGVAYNDPHAGVIANTLWLRDNLLLPTGEGDGTREATLYLTGDIELYGYVHVLSPLHTASTIGPDGLLATLDLSISAGMFDSELGS